MAAMAVGASHIRPYVDIKVLVAGLLCFGISYTLTTWAIHQVGVVAEHVNNTVTGGQRVENATRVLCWVLVAPSNHWRKAVHIRETWGRRCDRLLFMSSRKDSRLPSVELPITTDRWITLWGKTKAALHYLYAHHLQHADWFLKADDDTYIIMENLKELLITANTSQPVYFGRRLWDMGDIKGRLNMKKVSEEFPSGGAGYVLSRKGIENIVEMGLDAKPELCQSGDVGSEDVELGRCMRRVGVKVIDSRDAFGFERFHPLPPEVHLMNKLPVWYHRLNLNAKRKGPECCSDHAISFHHIEPNMMYVLDYLIYHLKPHGIFSSLIRPHETNLDELSRFVENTEYNRRKGSERLHSTPDQADSGYSDTSNVLDYVNLHPHKQGFTESESKLHHHVTNKQSHADGLVGQGSGETGQKHVDDRKGARVRANMGGIQEN